MPISIPLATVPDHLDAFRGDGPTYVICHSGGRSRRACEFVDAQGLDGVQTVNVEGGTERVDRLRARGGPRGPALVTHRWVDRTAELDEVIDVLVTEPRYAIDTEFHRERTYFPRLALVQLAWPGGLVLVDPLAVDPAPLTRLFDSPALAVAHAAQQDLDVLTHAVGAIPARLFDTQVAAGFVGYGTPSLSSLLQGELGHHAGQGRPADRLAAPPADGRPAVVRRGRRRVAARAARPPRRRAGVARPARLGRGGVRGAAHPPDGGDRPRAGLDQAEGRPVAAAKSRAVAQAVAAWREREAAATDTPVRQVLPDLAILGIAQRQPSTLDELAQARGVDERHRRGRIGPRDPRRRRRRQGGRRRRPSPTPSTSSTAPSARP